MNHNKNVKLQEKLRYMIHGWCDIVELALAILVGIVLLLTAVFYILNFFRLPSIVSDTSCFQVFLQNIFILVVGIEFIKMLLKPNVKNVIDVLIFLVARHLIIDHSTPFGMLLCVLSIILLYGFWFWIKYMRQKNELFRSATDCEVAKAAELPGNENSEREDTAK